MEKDRKVGMPTKVSYEEFLKWCDEDTQAEWVDGEVVMVSPASKRHQEIIGFLSGILVPYTQVRDLGTVLTAPFQMYLADVQRGREPDVLFVAKEHLHRLQETHLNGPADLAIEILSPESRLRDRGEKLAEYEAAGVHEYWIIDPDEKRADFYVLGDDGRYDRRRPEGGRYHSGVLAGFELRVEWLWAEPLPPVLSVLQELKLI